MRYLGLSLLVAAVVTLCLWQQLKQNPVIQNAIIEKRESVKSGVKWQDSLMKVLPNGIDTTIIVKDINGASLKFSQYIKPIFNHDAIIYQDKGVWRLHRLNKQSQDSLSKDDTAIARTERWRAYREDDTITSYKVKLASIAHVLAQADYLLVLKSKRKMLVKRKGLLLKSFTINMGWAPVGHKQVDGDGKTPEGLYYLDLKHERSDQFYKSFWISYPNENDKRFAKKRNLKPGSGVSIHGTKPNKINAKDWTAGCIALQNKDMDTLFAYVADGTLIEIRK